MAGEEVIELSVEETNKLRIELGLKPLRVTSSSSSSHPDTTQTISTSTGSTSTKTNSSDEINLSIEETNALRSQLGLAPLRSSSSSSEPSGRKPSEAVHAPATNTREQDEVKKRIQEAKLKREVEAGVAKMKKSVFSSEKINDGGTSSGGGTLSWVEKMRSNKNKGAEGEGGNDDNDKKKVKNKKTKKKSKNNSNNQSDNDVTMKEYSNDDLKDQNITVTHNSTDFEAGTTTILTLADKSILDAEEEGDDANALENVNMAENTTAKDNLRRKRMVEMGVGHAGGYAGYDDDEFEELGGQSLILGMDKPKGSGVSNTGADEQSKKRKGFKLGDSTHDYNNNKEKQEKSDLFSQFNGNSISLQSTKNANSRQADFMTYEEEEAMGISSINKEDIEKRRKKKEKKLLKKMKKKEKNAKKSKSHDAAKISNGILESGESNVGDGRDKKQSLLDDLEGSAPTNMHKGNNGKRKRKRRRVMNDDSEDEDENRSEIRQSNQGGDEKMETEEEDVTVQKERKKKFDSIMEKGNTRTNKVFKEVNKGSEIESNNKETLEELNKDDSDALLATALSKARRLRRLRELNAKSSSEKVEKENKSTTTKGADAVVQSIRKMREEISNPDENETSKTDNGRITFALDATKEFTRALRSQQSQTMTNSKPTKEIIQEATSVNVESTEAVKSNLIEVDEENANNKEEQPMSLEELADEVKEDHQEASGGFGDTASTVPVGRGLSSFLSMLKHTGDITGKNAGKEELRGRAKDERNYEDYEKLNLKEVVKLDTSRMNGPVYDKDVEFANREIKLEYRDEHGRLLTRKEAYRNLCYQFHGHGSSKKNEERRLKQVERERTEASRGRHDNSGTLGALKATQKATGKAFVLHKT